MNEIVTEARTSRNQARRLDIQGLRAVAVLMVVAFHAGLPVPGGFLGVDVFFVISGFVIAAMLGREWQTTGRVNYKQFYLRRFKRLTPALALMIVVTMVMSIVVLSPLGIQQTAAQTGVGALFLVANVVIARTTGGYFDADAHLNPLLHTWSLSVEEQFYLVFPALIAVCWGLARRRSRLRSAPVVIIGVLALVSFALACFATTIVVTVLPHALRVFGPHVRWISDLVGFYSPLTRSWEFAAGVLLALTVHKLPVNSRAIAAAAGLTGTGMLAASLWLIPDSAVFPGVWTLLPVIGTVLLIAAGSGAQNNITDLLSRRPMARIGDWSYSIYLWHWPFIVCAERLWPSATLPLTVVAAALSFAPAIASYYWIEAPIRQMTGFSGKRAFRVFAVTMTIPLLICVFTLYAARHGYWSRGVQNMQATVMTPHATQGCTLDPATEGVTRPCIFGEGAPGKPIFVVGDSTAEHLAEAAILAGREMERPVDVLPIHGCLFKDVVIDSGNPVRDQLCRARYESAMDWLVNESPGTVVISDLNSDYGRSAQGGRRVGFQKGPFATSSEEAVRVLDNGLISTIETLEEAGHAVLLVLSAPYFKEFDPLRCTLRELQSDTCEAHLSRAEMDTAQQPERTALQQIARETGAGVWDPRDYFCTPEVCSTRSDNKNVYRDSVHISAAASALLAESLEEAIRDVPPPNSPSR